MPVPSASDPAGIVIVAVPVLSVAAAELYPPRVTVTVPVGAGVPLTMTVTVSACVVVMLDEDGVTVTEGVDFVTVTLADVPVALL